MNRTAKWAGNCKNKLDSYALKSFFFLNVLKSSFSLLPLPIPSILARDSLLLVGTWILQNLSQHHDAIIQYLDQGLECQTRHLSTEIIPGSN